MSETVNQPELTAEEIADLKKKSLDFYKDRIEFLTVQFEFEKLVADIEDAKLRGLIARLKMAQITAPEKEDEDEEPTPKKSK